MNRIVFAAIAVTLGASAAMGGVIEDRKALMKRSGEEARAGAAMVRGETPFNLDRAQAILATYADKAAKLPTLFPADSKTGDTAAAPAIWEKSAEFKAQIEKFSADVKSAQASVKDLDSFKAGFAAVGKNCGGCHETFRIKK
jgi:cytochrome c556